ncbi:MAG: T9SS type A sorting domain-containing protein [Bacteroidales bacterium]|jgi:hypothetical protein|nr:T9SS type A sorting domain-containing protein [Bacteroidales bacterium]MDD4213510.1 T9SS type A sorting domain-containing protein [Bacteroidales bacterium]
MKKVLLLAVALIFSFTVMAQHIPAKIDPALKYLKVTKVNGAIHEFTNFSTEVNPTVTPRPSKAINEVIIGITKYDLQSNSSVQNRIYLHDDGTIGATYNYGMTEESFADRGTGYNYYDLTNWGAQPTERVETVRSGWPSYAPLGTNGEIVVSHNGSTGLTISKRTPKGTGAWTESTLVGPATTGGSDKTALLWPRMITVGDTIHIIACTDQPTTTGTYWYYEGLSLALVYIRSVDGGTTWDAPRILPGMDSASVVTEFSKGFGGDSYSWADPKNGKIAFIVGESWTNTFIMKSPDGGDTWTKIPVYNFPSGITIPTPIIPTTDGCYALALDSTGKAHAVFGIMRVSDDNASDDQSSFYPYTDGLVYWNEDMAVLDSTALGDPDGLFNNGMLAGYMIDYDGSGEIEFPTPSGDWAIGTYYVSLSSFPHLNIDDDGTMYISYSSCREDRLTPDGGQIYRHLYVVKYDGAWSDATDINAGFLHDFDECVFGSMSFTMDDKLHIVYQADVIVGLAVRGDETAYGDNYIYYTNLMKTDVGTAIGVKENISNNINMNIYPNPSSDYTNINLNLEKSSDVKVTVTNLVGQEVISKTYGKLINGNHTLSMNIKSLNSGIYFFTVEAANERITKKIIVE